VLGDTEAVLTGTSSDRWGQPNGLDSGELTITRAGRTVLHQPITPPAGQASVQLTDISTSASPATASGPLCLVRFTPGAASLALLAFTTAGAHCCTTMRAVPTPGGGTGPAASVETDLGNAGGSLQATASGPIIVTADDAFDYAFTAYAFSDPPVRILTIGKTGFADVTRAHADLVKTDLARHWADYNDPNDQQPLGALSGWAAEKCLLDPTRHATDMWTYLDQQLEAGKLVDSFAGLTGQQYLDALRKLVVSSRYCLDPGAAVPAGSSPATAGASATP
jgi:hypothetical protein